MERRSLYFEKAGVENTEKLLEFVKRYAIENGIRDLVIASTTGETGARASRLFEGFNIVVVTHHFGFPKPGESELAEEYRQEILANRAKLFTGTHALSGAERAIRRKFGTVEPLEIIANTYRTLGEGTKVCVEISLMASDAGLIPVDRDVISIAGTSRGADTALLIRPASSSNFFDLKIKEVIAKPRDF